MAGRIAEAGDFLARAFFKKPELELAVQVEYYEDGKPVVYPRRWFILAALCIGYFTWNFHTSRQTALIAEYALYFDTTNEFQSPPEFGIDFLTIADNFYLLFFYPLAGAIVDTYGLKTMSVGAVLQAVAVWWWYLSFDNYTSVLVSKILTSFAGPLMTCNLLKIANNWFAEDQRALAVALGAMIGSLGAGVALVIAPLFSTGELAVEPALKSCDLTSISNYNFTDPSRELCPEEAKENFCCAAPTNIDGLNLMMAFFATAVAVYTVAVVQESPPTPPSKAGTVRRGPTFKKAVEIMMSHPNYLQVCLADFVCSGPPLTLFSTIDRLFSTKVTDIATIILSLSFIVALPLGSYFSLQLSKSKKFFEYTATGYSSGFVSWILVTIFFFVDTPTTDVFMALLGGVAMICYVVWTVAVYELKLEYVFSQEWAVQGYVVAIDRTIINLSSLVFLAAIPPERYKGGGISGAEFTFIVGAFFMALGVLLIMTVKPKRKYLRMEYEAEKGETIAEILNESKVFNSQFDPEVVKSVQSQIQSMKEKSQIQSIFESVMSNKSKAKDIKATAKEDDNVSV